MTGTIGDILSFRSASFLPLSSAALVLSLEVGLGSLERSHQPRASFFFPNRRLGALAYDPPPLVHLEAPLTILFPTSLPFV